MSKLVDNSTFLDEPVGKIAIHRQHGVHQFQCDLAIESVLNGKIDGGHAAFAKLADDGVTRNFHGFRCFCSAQ